MVMPAGVGSVTGDGETTGGVTTGVGEGDGLGLASDDGLDSGELEALGFGCVQADATSISAASSTAARIPPFLNALSSLFETRSKDCVLVATNQIEELRPRARVPAEGAEHARGDHLPAWFL